MKKIAKATGKKILSKLHGVARVEALTYYEIYSYRESVNFYNNYEHCYKGDQSEDRE